MTILKHKSNIEKKKEVGLTKIQNTIIKYLFYRNQETKYKNKKEKLGTEIKKELQKSPEIKFEYKEKEFQAKMNGGKIITKEVISNFPSLSTELPEVILYLFENNLVTNFDVDLQKIPLHVYETLKDNGFVETKTILGKTSLGVYSKEIAE